MSKRDEYLSYLKSEAWQARRVALIRRNLSAACYCCDAIHSHANPLDLHHMTYERFGHEADGDLVTVCRACHDLIHSFLRHKSLRAATEHVRTIRAAAAQRRNAPTTSKLPPAPKPVDRKVEVSFAGCVHPGGRGADIRQANRLASRAAASVNRRLMRKAQTNDTKCHWREAAAKLEARGAQSFMPNAGRPVLNLDGDQPVTRPAPQQRSP